MNLIIILINLLLCVILNNAITLILIRMKHLFKNPQKKGKSYICNSEERILIELSEIKIKSVKKIGENNSYYIDCIIPYKTNKEKIEIIKSVDNDASAFISDTFNEDNDDNQDNEDNERYIKSYDTDENSMTLILNSKIDAELFINEEEKDINELINFILSNKKNKNLIINIDIIFLGIYISKESIINKWALKYINIEELTDNNNNDWNRKEIEEEWHYDLMTYEEEVNKKIAKLQENLIETKKLYNDIINENNSKNWENKIDKLKNNILSIYDNR